MKSAKHLPADQLILVRPRIYIGENISIGPGKIDLLRVIAETRSIASAARMLNIPYKRAWLLVDSLNDGFGSPVVETISGGKGGGGSSLTPLGEQLVAAYQALEDRINSQSIAELETLRALVK